MTWIKCSERLPYESDDLDYIVYGSPCCGTHQPTPIVIQARWRRAYHGFEFGEYDCPIDVTHWQPLPEPPNE